MFVLFLSSFIVAFHPVWHGPFMIVTLIGVLGLIEGGLYLLFPGALRRILGLMR
jgi:ABC-type uncharacterized transport system permease subunit